jgi:GNAT superfamily N-acetyltransferase
MTGVEFRPEAFDAPAAFELTEAVQQEYVLRYGTRDETQIEVAQFAPPLGIFVLGWDGDQPVACGGVRLITPDLGELKRMYVAPAARRRGIARALLAHLEEEARTLGATRLRLEVGIRQPEALTLYPSAAYLPVEPFGHYAADPLARHFAKALVDVRDTNA